MGGRPQTFCLSLLCRRSPRNDFRIAVAHGIQHLTVKALKNLFLLTIERLRIAEGRPHVRQVGCGNDEHAFAPKAITKCGDTL